MEKDEFAARLNVLAAAMALVIAILVARVGYLQIYEGEYYAELAEGNRIRIIPIVAPRGSFYDRNGKLLVTNRPGFTVSLLPLTEPISPEVIARVSKLLDVPIDEIQRRIDIHYSFDPIKIKQDVTPDVVAIIEEQKADYRGVIIEVQPVRNYIMKEGAAHVLGYVSEISEYELEEMKAEGYKAGDIVGKFGIEKMYDKEIRGVNGGAQVEVDVNGKPVRILGKVEPTPGQDIYLTLDKDLQLAAEKAVDDTLAEIGAHAAALVALDPQSGDVLAMVSRPAFDPNLFAHGISEKDWRALNENPYHPLDNKAISGEYPPGSTFKIVTGTAALDAGVVTPDELIYDGGTHWLVPKGNAGGEVLGWLNFRDAMAHSDNVYFYELGNRLGAERLEHYARLFGLGQPTGIDLPYEAPGLADWKEYKARVYGDDFYLSEVMDAAIGQGFNLVTPLQAAFYTAQVAASGLRFRPHLMRGVPAALPPLPVTGWVLAAVQDSLGAVVTEGTGRALGLPFPVAAKTGTAENSGGADHGWFVAYAPRVGARVVVSVVVEGGGFGAVSALPVARAFLAAGGLEDNFEKIFEA